MTLKEMNKQAKELGLCGYDTAESIFRHGLHSLLSSKEALKADRENPLKYQIDRIINDLHDIQIAENILREWYGIEFCDTSTHKGCANGLGVHVFRGIDELAQALGVEPKITDEYDLTKTFRYDWCDFYQLAERHSTNYLKAFSGNTSHYSTTYEKAYGKAVADDK